MNKREAKLRALKLCSYALQKAIERGDILNMVDDDTPDDEAERINDAATDFLNSINSRVRRLEKPHIK